MLFSVNHFKDKTNDESSYAKSGKHEERVGVIVLQRVGYSGVARIKYLADKKGKKPKSDILNPENKGIG